MATDFHDKPFDDQTKLKLEIFRRYTREWLPVFLSRKTYDSIDIFDFFAGPGRDSEGVQGSPLILIDEIKKCLANSRLPTAGNISISLFFNDADPDKIQSLQREIASEKESRLRINFTSGLFQEAFDASKTVLAGPSAAKLVILDQRGFKEITSDIFRQLIELPATDFMFFISSFHLKRFISTEEVKRYFPKTPDREVNAIPATDIHRFVCSYYEKLVPPGRKYYLAPFSIKKGPNIYGIIFGSSVLLGLEKFLKVCWNLDGVSGEANYDIDGDLVRRFKTLYRETNTSKKIDLFERRLVSFLDVYRSNNELYRFTLEQGCLPKQAVGVLRGLQKGGSLETDPADTRKSSFYLNWKCYCGQVVKARFRIKK